MVNDKGMSSKDKKWFFAQLDTLLRSGLDFSRAFSLLTECASGKGKVMCDRLFHRIVSGSTLAQAMSYEPEFSQMDRSVVRIGEETGRLADALSFLSSYYEKKESRRRMIVGALSYPLITLGVAVVVLAFMLLVVVPMFEQVYDRMGGELPEMTRWVVSFSKAAPAVLTVLAAVVLSLWLIRKFYGKTERYRAVTSSAVLRLPVVGSLVCKYNSAKFCRIFHLLVSADVPVLGALDLLRGIMDFHPFCLSIDSAVSSIGKGGTLSDGLSAYSSLYGKRLLVLMKVGEETGNLPRQLQFQADTLDAELEYEINQLNTIAQPLLILCIGAIVAFVLIAMYMPMFRLGMTIG